jgi:GH35 family endo-1,4-beta-xylanase
VKPSGESVSALVFSSKGEPVGEAELAGAMVLDLEFFPPFEHRVEAETGKVTLPAPDGPFALCVPLPVDGFGHVYLYADNGGAGYMASEVGGKALNFCLEAAESRAAAVARAEGRFREAGTRASSDYEERMSRARNLLEDARSKKADAAACAKLAMASLSESMHAGEMLVVEHARSRIASRPKRTDFRFGCNGFRYPEKGEPYARAFGELLDFATLPFYRAHTEPEEGKRDFSKVEKILEWTGRSGIEVKGHPLVWFHRAGIPEWMKGRSYDEVASAHRGYIADAVARFGDRIKTWDVINEAHDWANDFGYSADQLVEMTRLAADATREADAGAVRIVNSCCTWSEYVARGRSYSGPIGRPARNVLAYVRDLIDAGVEFEVIGLQMYYPARDMFEIDRHLEMFCRLGKPVHITELGVSSSVEPRARGDIKTPSPRYWHIRPWSESEQADWIEAYYTICYAKPEIEALTWWDFCDPAFIPHGGLVDENLRPKEAYPRLKGLIEGWR